MFLYYRDNGVVVMRSEEKMETPLNIIEINPTDDERQKIENNYEQRIEEGQLIFKVPEHLAQEIKQAEVQKIKDDLDSGTSSKVILQRLLEII